MSQLELDLGPLVGNVVELRHAALADDQPPLRCRVTRTGPAGVDLQVLTWPTPQLQRIIPRTLLGVPYRCVTTVCRS